MNTRLILGDCLRRMIDIPSRSVDLILADLPYGTTGCEWDTPISLPLLWSHFNRLLKPRRAIVLTASQPFTSTLIVSNREWFKYCWVWEKSLVGDVFNAKNKPLKIHEDICVFSPGTTANGSDNRMIYNPQGVVPGNGKHKRCETDRAFAGKRPSHPEYFEYAGTNYPKSIIGIANPNHESVHETQKPVALMQYLILTYSNEGDTVLDPTMGSGTTGIACINTDRNFIGIERDPEIFARAEKRIEDARFAMPLFPV